MGVTGEVAPRDLRVSDAEREHVATLLQRAVGEGRITVTEFTERMDTAMSARTRAELNVVLVDLPGAAVAQPTTGDVLELGAGVGDLKRRGYWVVPATVRVSGALGDALLDFTEAEFTSPATTIELNRGVGDTLLVIPEDATVDADAVRTAVGEVKDRTVRRRGPGTHHFVVRGGSKMGDIRIVHPRAWRLGPLTVHRPFRVTWGRKPSS